MSKVRETKDFRVTDKRKPMRILRNTDKSDYEPITITEALQKSVDKYSDHPALAYNDPTTKNWKFINYKEYKAKVDQFAKVFIKLGLQRWGSVAVLAFNSVEWFITELACIHAGGIITGIYTTNSVDSTQFVIESSGATIVVVDDAKQMDKVREIKRKLPHLKIVVQTREPFADTSEGFYRWEDLENMSVDDVEDEYQQRLADIHVNDCCSFIFTSGTTGRPKGVMLTHDNLLFVAKTGCDFEKFKNAQEVLISYLPLSHIAAQIVDIYACLTSAGTVYFADKDALKGSLAKTIRQVRPTRFLGVPRVYEKMHEKMLEIGSTQNFLMRAVGSWAKGVTLQHHLDRMSGKETNTLQYQLAKKFIISKVKTAMGFDRCQTFSSGAAPISIETKKYFMSLDMPIIEIFGMSESSGGHSFSTTDAPNFDTVGKGLPNVLTKIHQPDENGDGEILVKGRHVMMGYLNDVDKTFETIDDDGWLSTGDVGRIDNDGNLYITGRLKEIIITAGGENVPPVHVENLVKKEIPAISNAFLVGDKKKYLTILISLKTQMQADTGAPLDDLSAESIKWIESLNLKYKKLSQILDGPDPDVLKAIEEGIQRANRNAISNAQKIQKFKILPHDFSIPTGEIGPTLKVKRNVVSEKYKDLIESMYQ